MGIKYVDAGTLQFLTAGSCKLSRLYLEGADHVPNIHNMHGADCQGPGPRHHPIEHPYIGILRCAGCGEPLQSGGQQGYQCPGYLTTFRDRRPCPSPQRVGHRSVERAFLAHLPKTLAELEVDAEQIARRVTTAPLLDELRNVKDQMMRLRFDWQDLQMPHEERHRLNDLDVQCSDLELRVAQKTDHSDLSDTTRELIELALRRTSGLESWPLDDPDRRPHIARLVALLYRWASIEKHGTNNRWATFSVRAYELSELNCDTGTSRISGPRSSMGRSAPRIVNQE